MGLTSLIITTIIVMLCGWFFLQRKTKAPLPPGRLGLPFIGETLEFMTATKNNNSLAFFNSRVAKYGEIFKTNILFAPSISFGTPEANKFLFANENKLFQLSWPSSAAKLAGESVANKVGKEHKNLRHTFMAFFGASSLHDFVPRLDNATKAHFQQFWEGRDEIKAMETIKHFLFSLVMDLFLSIIEGPEFHSMQHDVEDYINGTFQLPINFPGFAYHKAKLGRDNIKRTLDMIISRRRKDTKEGKVEMYHDLLSFLLNTPHDEEGNPIKDEEIKDNIALLLFAGIETTSTTISMALKYLFLNPHCLQEVVKEQMEISKTKDGAPLNWEDTRKMKYTWCVLQECLRIQPALEQAFRICIKEFEYGGFTIPKGWKVFWSAHRTHMSPQIFPNPTKFDPSRFEGSGPTPFSFLGFGGGLRMCLGNEFARITMLIFLHYMVLNYEWCMVDPNEKNYVIPAPTFQKGLQLKLQKK
ncbi:unnamed protein product [Sphagnum troendelagicum]|uniref:Cytochrome P450 n=1 Tax=Sphagnum troendelagicum TaxID=128251 RepID=A0ABP0UJ94_9BRYO